MRLTKTILLIFSAGVITGCSTHTEPDGEHNNVIQFVNPFIGTSGMERSLEGRTHPGAQVPFGMVSVCPFNAYDTAIMKNIRNHSRFQSPYFKDRTHIAGFSHVNLSGVGCPELGAVLLMPTTGPVQTRVDQYFSPYSQEEASPGYYSTYLTRYGIKAAMSATERTGISRYTFPAGTSNILINLGLAQTNQYGSAVKLISKTRAEGYRKFGRFCGSNTVQTVYFAVEFSKPAGVTGVWNSDSISLNNVQEATGNETGACFTFQTGNNESIDVKVGVSYVSTANAWLNLQTEQPGFDFAAIRKNAGEAWNRELSKILVEGGTPDDKTIFYTALYHTLIHPNIYNDVNGEYPAMGNHATQKANGYNRYTVYSLWDTYRNLHQLFTLVYPERQLDMIKSMLDMYRENGWLPKWELAGNETMVMVGDPAIPVIADAWLKGIKQFDIKVAYEAMKKSSTLPEPENALRPGLDAYLHYGYIPMDVENKKETWGPVSTTLEYNLADYSLAKMAEDLGKSADAQQFLHRSTGYKNFFNQQFGLLCPKLKDGNWYHPFDPLYDKWPGGPGYVEGNAWHYSFFVPHDIPGLIELFGSGEKFVDQLQHCFDEKYFSMGNEPDIAYPFLFNYVSGQEWRTQKEVRAAIYNNYKNAPAGLPGNDDCGTMSAWLVFAMAGLYPDCPAKTDYQITSPVFDKVTIRLNPAFYRGRSFTIKAHNNSRENVYIQVMKLNKKAWNRYTISHEAITRGGELEMYVDDKK